ncbi:uncharacterized protein LOC121977616 isoform X2 [Zingiber officinale]|nr:uncharacterized protein LOC121973406 [Zingiber officinale]XP_042386021.1 uncharacterized protein LOC121977616 isoform X2 [Zingiber officinale]
MEETGLRWPWWAAASSAQLTAGIAWYRRGYCGSGASMPFKAFAIATLFVGAGSTAVRSALLAAGIRTVDDMKEVGAGLRRWMRTTPGAD